MPRPASTPRAFSLVEILVVIAIVAILVGISVPTFNAMAEGGQRGRARAMLQSLAGVADEFQMKTGAHINHADPGVTVGGAGDNTIGYFMAQARQVPACENLMKAAAGAKYVEDVNGDGTTWGNADDVAILDPWENKIRYARRVDHSDGVAADDYLPPYPQPFFASAGPDGLWGSVDSAGVPDAEAQDNLYSFDAD